MHINPLLVVCGPTASGKTRLAVDLAKYFNGEVVSADSMQIYRRMNIGTAKPDKSEMCGIRHHLLDIIDPEDLFSLVDYVDLARTTISEITNRGHLPILAGGTGLYISSIVNNIQFNDIPTDPSIRESIYLELEMQGAQHLWAKLQECDLELAKKLHPNNIGRVVRALEVYMLTGKPMSELQRLSRSIPLPYNLTMIGLRFEDRQFLYDRIDERVNVMFNNGLYNEAQDLWCSNISFTAAQAIGYKELFLHFNNQITLEEAKEDIKRNSRRYSKRQITWLNKDDRINWLNIDNPENYNSILNKAIEIASSKIK